MSTQNMAREQFIRYILRRIGIWLLIFLVVAIFAAPVAWYLIQRADARMALREAKNVELAIKLTTAQAYGEGKSIYDGKTASGLNEQFLDEIYQCSGVDGSIYIAKWNVKYNKVQEFQYIKGEITVYFTYDFDKSKSSWRADYRLPLLNYSGTD